MADKKNAQVLNGNQLSLAVVTLSGDMVASGGKIDTTCLIDTASGKQLAHKVFVVGVAGDAGLITVVHTLPETGEPGKFYGVMMDEVTKDGYAIIQFFIWYGGEWCAAGAFDVYIDPDNLVYKTDKNVANGVAGLNASAKLSSSVIPYATADNVGGIKSSFDSATGTWTVITEDL
jgi:hypothetical protein